jgi:selenocysteine-specific elongation factor
VLARPGTLQASYMVDIDLQFLSSNKKPVKNRTRVRFHTGTSEILGNLILLDREELAPGDSLVAQLRLDAPVSLIRGDRFVIRSYSPVRTIGGGQVLNPIAPKHKRFKPQIIDNLTRLATLEDEALVDFYTDMSNYQGAGFKDLLIMTNLTEKKLEGMIQSLLSNQTLILLDRENRLYIHKNSFQTLKTRLSELLEAYHKAHPLKAGMPKEELKSKIQANLNPKLFNLLLNQMLKENQVAAEGETIRLTSHQVALGIDQEEISQKIQSAYRDSGLQPPYFKELSKELSVEGSRAKDVLMVLVKDAKLVKVKEDLFFDAAAVDSLRTKLVDFLNRNGEINTPQFKEMTGVSRKYLIPLLEFFDAKNVTIRVGDVRKLRRG